MRRRTKQEVIKLAQRWYQRYGLIPVDLHVELMRRGIDASVAEQNS